VVDVFDEFEEDRCDGVEGHFDGDRPASWYEAVYPIRVCAVSEREVCEDIGERDVVLVCEPISFAESVLEDVVCDAEIVHGCDSENTPDEEVSGRILFVLCSVLKR
jgi:hypothetical protein